MLQRDRVFPQEQVMDIRTLSSECAVAAQLANTDIAEAAERGFRVIVNNRPDNEEPGQPSSRELEQAARLHGLAYYHVPVSGGIPEAAVSAFHDALAAHDGPALAFCKSGMRSAALWAMQAAAGSNIDAILETTRQAGYNLEALRPGLQSRSP